MYEHIDMCMCTHNYVYMYKGGVELIITFINEKGGVGKTSLCFNSAWYFAEQGKRILMVDLDGQRANLTYMAGIDKTQSTATMYDVLTKKENIKRTVLVVEDNLHIVPATNAVINLTAQNGSIDTMRAAMREVESYYDYIFIDVSPSPNRSHALALSTSDYVIIPMLADIMSLESNMGISASIKHVQSEVNDRLRVLGIVFNKYTWRTKLSKQVLNAAEKMASSLNSRVFSSHIRNNVSLAECVGKHVGITTYDPKSNGADDIRAFCKEIIKEVNNHEQK